MTRRANPKTPTGPAPAAARPSLSRQVYDELRNRLRRGMVTPEDRLVDLEIAAQLGMSRMPVREALLQLVSEGYLVSTARGYRIPTLSRADVTDIFEVRRLLEPRAAALAARDISRSRVGRLDAAWDEARAALEAGDFSRLFQANIAFREVWLGAVRNKRMAETISRFADQVLTVGHGTLRDPASQRVAVAGLGDLHDAFTRHDSVAAHDSMRRFIDAAERTFAALPAHAAH